MSWWDRATKEQRLAQIDGGIECRMSARQIGLNVGATKGAVYNLGWSCGRKFPAPASNQSGAGKVSGIMTARRRGTADYEIRSAFQIFDKQDHHEEFFLEELPQ